MTYSKNLPKVKGVLTTMKTFGYVGIVFDVGYSLSQIYEAYVYG